MSGYLRQVGFHSNHEFHAYMQTLYRDRGLENSGDKRVFNHPDTLTPSHPDTRGNRGWELRATMGNPVNGQSRRCARSSQLKKRKAC